MQHDLMRYQIGSYAHCKYEAIHSFDGRTLKKCPKKHINTKQQNQNQQVDRKKIIYFENE